MSGKRTKLHSIEANYIYAKVLLALNKFEEFSKLSIPVRNSLIDSICEEIIEAANNSASDIEALKFEINSYKLSDEEKSVFYNSSRYNENVKKPANFNDLLEEKYSRLIEKIVTEKLKL
ncbi:MAG: hypothetical protein GXO87_01115 [Chlorobi bacterium]|nr:hypothetical protein [Chlorobiota bacterium]